ncbi:MAG: hypothetical protein RLZZ628_1782 [Bacteroidota bacterium]|jgi:hypothetical protein
MSISLKRLFKERTVLTTMVGAGFAAWGLLDFFYVRFALSELPVPAQIIISILCAFLLTGGRIAFMTLDMNSTIQRKTTISWFAKGATVAMALYVMMETSYMAATFGKSQSMINALMVIFQGINVMLLLFEIFLVVSLQPSAQLVGHQEQAVYDKMAKDLQDANLYISDLKNLLNDANGRNIQLANEKTTLQKELYRIRVNNNQIESPKDTPQNGVKKP